MVSEAQARLAHSIATMGVEPYAQLVQLMDGKNSKVEGYKAIRKAFDQIYAERLLFEAYRFSRQAAEWTELSFGQALWAWMRRYLSPAAALRFVDIEIQVHTSMQEHGIKQEDRRLDGDANRYLLARINFCLQDDPFAGEWRTRQAEAHQCYEFWLTRLDPKEGPAWRAQHPRMTTPLLWKITQPKIPTAATPMVCLPGTIEYACASARLAHAQMEAWVRNFCFLDHDAHAAQQALRYYATQEIPAADVYLFNLSGILSRDQIAEAIRCAIGAYSDAVSTIRQADVPLVLCHPIDPSEYAVESQVKEWTRVLERVQALNEAE